MAKGYFFKVPYGKVRRRWEYGRYDSKAAVLDANPGATDIVTARQAIQKFGPEATGAMARNCILYRPEAEQEFPEEIVILLR